MLTEDQIRAIIEGEGVVISTTLAGVLHKNYVAVRRVKRTTQQLSAMFITAARFAKGSLCEKIDREDLAETFSLGPTTDTLWNPLDEICPERDEIEEGILYDDMSYVPWIAARIVLDQDNFPVPYA